MYNNVYQEYINNMLGGVPRNQSAFENMPLATNNMYDNYQMQSNTNLDLERFYPELYKLLYPMIQTACMRNTKPITEETIDEMVKEIYTSFNADGDMTILNINLTNNTNGKTKAAEQQSSLNRTSSKTSSAETRTSEADETRVARPNNFVLNDLIRILLIRELLGRPGNRPPIRPGFPPQRPGGPGRPPFRPRGNTFESQDFMMYEDPSMYLDINREYIF